MSPSITCPSVCWIDPCGMLPFSPSRIGKTPIYRSARVRRPGPLLGLFLHGSAAHKPGHSTDQRSNKVGGTCHAQVRRGSASCRPVLGRGAIAQSPTAPLATFPTELLAQQRCPGDTVVWVNFPSGIYHFRGERWYGNTKSGAYVCRREADRAGDRATRNGQ